MDAVSDVGELHAAQQMWRRLKDRDFHWAAVVYRILLPRVTFIGVTGSCGKTTTRELIAAVLASRFRGSRNRGNNNLPADIAKIVLDVRPWDDFCVVEIAAAQGGTRFPLERPLRMVRPQIGVVTNIGSDHIDAFGSLEAIAAEKGKLIAALPREGTAVLNADDPYVLAMRERFGGRVITYGLSPSAMLRADNVRSEWPEALSFSIHYQGRSCRVQTQLCGSHWVSCALAAIAVGLAMKIPLEVAATAIGAAAPVKGRMYPVSTPDGVTFIRDDAKAPLWSIPHALQFMKDARAGRKIIVFGTISDYSGNSDRKYISVAKQALDVADHVVFAGPSAPKASKAKRDAPAGALDAFYSVEAAADHLRRLLRPGDLVLLKGGSKDGLGDLIPQHSGVDQPRNRQDAQPPPDTHLLEHKVKSRLDPTAWKQPVRAVVGLGNTGEQFQHTPHNIGQRVLDRIASTRQAQWRETDGAVLANIERREGPVYLLKPLTMVNDTGPALLRLSNQLKFTAAECVLIQDDIDLPLGTVRVHTQAGDGGHRGVRSVFEVFRTSAIRRVRVGVGRPGRKGRLRDYVLEPFSPSDAPSVEQACAQAAQRVLDILQEEA
jgi:UDP-N-acetylmuramoyl-tripeptide--D-alanyl-D-alanine ligase